MLWLFPPFVFSAAGHTHHQLCDNCTNTFCQLHCNRTAKVQRRLFVLHHCEKTNQWNNLADFSNALLPHHHLRLYQYPYSPYSLLSPGWWRNHGSPQPRSSQFRSACSLLLGRRLAHFSSSEASKRPIQTLRWAQSSRGSILGCCWLSSRVSSCGP